MHCLEVQRVNVDEEGRKLDVILTEENLSKAIGRKGKIKTCNKINEL